jgi:putative ABC transport system permease protein
VLEAVGQIPGVMGVSSSQVHFSLGSSAQTFLAIEGVPLRDSTGIVVNIRHVMPDLFRVMRARMVEGRPLEASDRGGSNPVAVVSASFARQHLGGHAIGARLRRTSIATLPWMEVVGVVEDVKDAGLGVNTGPTVYVPYLQENQPTVIMTVIARLRTLPSSIEKTFKNAVWSVDPTQAINRVALVDDIERESAAQPRFQMLVVALFSVGALALVIGGIYALTLFSVLRRSREIAVRGALGASPATLVSDAVWQGLRPVAIGIGGGVAAAVPIARLMQRALKQEFGASDLPLMMAVLLALLFTTAVAAYLPARRVTRVSPAEALQS